MAGPNQPTPFRIRQGTRDDIADVVRINDDAFSPGIMNKLMYPNGMSDEAKSKLAAVFAKSFDDAETSEGVDLKQKAYESFLAVAETVPEGDKSNSEVIAFAFWVIWREPRPEDEWSVQEPVSAAEGLDLEVAKEFVGGIRAMRVRNMRGDPGICLRMLCCTPTRSRLGAGSALLRWVLELADREGLPCWLEASPQGYPLYKRFGFKAVDVMDLRITEKWGAVRSPSEDWGANTAVEVAGIAPDGVYRSTGMRRLPVHG